MFSFFQKLIYNFQARWRRQAHLRLGRSGENAACSFLRNNGIEVLCRNYTFGKTEIDIVARENDTLCFIEVKTRRYKPGISPAEAVDEAKKRRIRKAAKQYLREIKFAKKRKIRFDIIEVILKEKNMLQINYIKSAFRMKRKRDLF